MMTYRIKRTDVSVNIAFTRSDSAFINVKV